MELQIWLGDSVNVIDFESHLIYCHIKLINLKNKMDYIVKQDRL